jgi:hypothetical protein
VKLSIDGKVIAKPELPKKESRRKASQRTYFALQEKWTKIISYSSKYIVFVHKLTKSYIFFSVTSIEIVYLQDYFRYGAYKLDLANLTK